MSGCHFVAEEERARVEEALLFPGGRLQRRHAGPPDAATGSLKAVRFLTVARKATRVLVVPLERIGDDYALST